MNNEKKQGLRNFASSEIAATLNRKFGLEGEGRHYLLLALLALILTIIIIPKGGFIPDYYAPGDIASRDVKAPKDLLIPDLPLTEKKRLEAEEAILPVYDFDPGAAQDIASRLIESLGMLQKETLKGNPAASLRHEVEAILDTPLTEYELSSLATVSGTAQQINGLRNVLIQALDQKIVGNLKLFQTDREKGVTVRNLLTRMEESGKEFETVIGPNRAQERIASGIRKMRGFSERDRQTLLITIQKLFRPNLTFNKSETEERKMQARELIKPVLFQVKKGEMIIREGERISEDQIKKLKALREMGSDSNVLRTLFGLLLCTILLLFVSHRFARVNIRKYRPNTRDLCFLASTIIGQFLLVKVAIFISGALESAFPYIDSNSYYYIFPFAAGAMLVRIVLNSEVALVFVVLTSLLLGIMFGDNLFIAFYALVGSLVGAQWVRQCKERNTIYRAGLRLSLINVWLIFGIHLMAGRGFDLQLLWKFGFGLAGGILCAVIVTGTISLVESLFKYTTDIKLLELANLNTPLLRELMIQAPGTYHHSIIVGNLVESAA